MDASDLPPPPPHVNRYILQAEEELRLEVAFQTKSTCSINLLKGSCELYGVELALQKAYRLSDGGLKLPLFTWHGCVVDIDCDHVDIGYTSDETNCNIAYVNTHAQLEALRDEAVPDRDGPRVLIAGPPESGKSSLTKILMAYATKLGRCPMWIDLDPADNALSIPGTLVACPMDRQAVQFECFATTGIPPGLAAPLVLWHGGTSLVPELFKAQVSALAQKVNRRLETDEWARASGIIVNTNGWIQDEGYNLLLHAIQALRIDVVLVMGHDRLYSMLRSALRPATPEGSQAEDGIKIIKVPRSGGVVSREKDFMRQHRSRSMKRYFYGDIVEPPTSTQASAGPAPASANTGMPNRVPQLTPFLAQIPFDKVRIYRYSAMSLSASLLPVAAAQATEAIQIVPVSLTEEGASSLQHKLLAVCHPQAVEEFQASQRPRDLYESGVAGFCVVERILMETEVIHLLSPCSGSLPSHTFLVGDVTWID